MSNTILAGEELIGRIVLQRGIGFRMMTVGQPTMTEDSK
jgi:hypothetical protein